MHGIYIGLPGLGRSTVALHLTDDLYKNAGKGGHLIGVEVSPMWPRLVELPPRIA